MSVRKMSASAVVTPGGNVTAVTNCCAALRRLLERMTREDFSGHVQIQVAVNNSHIQSYRTAIILPAPTN